MFVKDLNLARQLRKTYCARKRKENGYRDFDHSGTLITVPAAVKQAISRLFSKTDPAMMPAATMIRAKAFKKPWHHLKQ